MVEIEKKIQTQKFTFLKKKTKNHVEDPQKECKSQDFVNLINAGISVSKNRKTESVTLEVKGEIEIELHQFDTTVADKSKEIDKDENENETMDGEIMVETA